jgi:hypothetical protein
VEIVPLDQPIGGLTRLGGETFISRSKLLVLDISMGLSSWNSSFVLFDDIVATYGYLCCYSSVEPYIIGLINILYIYL